MPGHLELNLDLPRSPSHRERFGAASHRVEIGTAGSVTLLMQCLLPALLRADGPSSLRIHGGTDVSWAPAVDYFKNVFLPALSSFGAKVSLEVLQRGYYPRGQGEVLLQVEPAKLKAAHLEGRTCDTGQSMQSMVQGVSHCSNLPEHVAARQADSAVQVLHEAGFQAHVAREALRLPSMGSGITLWSGCKGASFLGERGLPAEKVGRRAAEELIIRAEIRRNCGRAPGRPAHSLSGPGWWKLHGAGDFSARQDQHLDGRAFLGCKN